MWRSCPQFQSQIQTSSRQFTIRIKRSLWHNIIMQSNLGLQCLCLREYPIPFIPFILLDRLIQIIVQCVVLVG